MVRHHPNKHAHFRSESLADLSETTDMLKQRHGAMQQRWADLDNGWEALTKKMAEVGLAMTSATKPDTILVNVGGLHLYTPRSVLEQTQGFLGDLFGGVVWDERLPRDSDGNIVLDESPSCVQHLISQLSVSCETPEIRPGLGMKDLRADELGYLPYVAGALGLSWLPLPTIGMAVTGGSTVFEAGEIAPLTATISSWCPGEPEGLELLYRASRDGWTANAFHARCDSSSSTITLVRVQAQGSETTDSIVGGFSSVSWGGNGGCSASPGAFLFMVKGGSGGGPGHFQPTKWGLRHGSTDRAVFRYPSGGPTFGGGKASDLLINMSGSPVIFFAFGFTYDIPGGSPYLALGAPPHSVVDLEVFRVCPKATMPETTTPPPSPPSGTAREGLIDCSAIVDSAPVSTVEHEDDIHQFGASIAESLKAERTALCHAQAELVQASAKAAASRDALAAVYGPEVAAGKKDPVVELSVRGPRAPAKISTLLSTLQACPDSALARRFNQTWTEREDAHGRAVIKDCSPAVFSKVLDVLRMRKRAAWADNHTGQGSAPMVCVAIKDTDREAFLQYVNMYFVGCESFITDYIKFQ